MLPSSRSLLAPTPLPAMGGPPPPPHLPNRGGHPLARPPACRAVTRVALAPSLSAAAATAASSSPPANKKKVLVPIAMGTEEMEAVILAGVLRRAGADVTLASVEDGLEVEASCGSRIVADKPIADCADKVFDLVALPGGMPGSVRLRDSEILQRITVRQAEEKRLYGAICAAPAVVLMPWGLHKRKKITCHPSFIEDLPTFRAVESNVQVSGELTTSRGPGTSFQFALSFVEQLFGPCTAEDMDTTLMTDVDDNLERSIEVNEIEWSSDHNPHVLIPIANGSEEMEIIMLANVLRRAKVNVVLASVEKSRSILGSQRMRIVADKSILDASALKYDLIILPGGPSGAERLHKSRVLKKLLKEQKQTGRMYGGICSSPMILQKQGLLQDKSVTAHPSIVDQLTCDVIDRSKVVIDGNLITGMGLGTVIDFSLAIIKKFFGHGRAKGVANGMVFDYPKS
uniref:DJ-1/PfpI domain-containing protein n=1 Tax=Oryza brachyantha TaxID=4533 RepID=J3MTR3_ORYBR